MNMIINISTTYPISQAPVINLSSNRWYSDKLGKKWESWKDPGKCKQMFTVQ